jgi:hypothetical protein
MQVRQDVKAKKKTTNVHAVYKIFMLGPLIWSEFPDSQREKETKISPFLIVIN